MKRTLSLITACLLMLLMFASCGSGKSDADSNANTTVDASSGVDLKTVMNDINSQYDLGELKTIDEASGLKRYYQIEEDSVKQFAAERSKSASAYTEIIMIEAVDAAAVENIKPKLAEHLRKQLSDAKSYHADQVAMLENCEVKENGSFVYLVISDKQDEIIGTIEKALA